MQTEVNVTLTVEADSETHALVVVADRMRDVIGHDRAWSDVLALEHRGEVIGFRLNHKVDPDA